MRELEPSPSAEDTLSFPAWVESSRESLSDAAAREAIRSRLFPSVTSSSQDPRRIGRFTILRKLGQGGMGVVYAAYDERLDRRLALKLVRRQLAVEDGAAALIREAQGLARLSHPNVVQIHEVGEHEGRVFLAMEFVAGETLRRWLEARPSWREILAVLIGAGRGLASAHEAGLVHRDFKPENVLVGADGRPRVLDFGLARGVELLANTEELPVTLDDEDGATAQSLPRKLAGTPAYMAPEVFAGKAAGPRADLWSFCVVAHEALFGARPFGGTTLLELASSVIEASPRSVERSGEVPARVHEVILRGLAKAPEDRWPGMPELLAALEAAAEPRARLRKLAVAALLGGGLAMFGAALLDEPTPKPCPIDASALAGTWDAQRRVALGRRYRASGLPYAEEAAAVVGERLDRWAEGWVAARRDACVATRVEGTQSEALLDARVACLDRQRAEVAGLLALVDEAPARAVIGESAALVEALPEAAACEGELDPAVALEDPERRAAILAGYERLERANGLRIIGEIDQARAELAALAEDPVVRGYAPLELELRLRAAELEFHVGRPRASLDALHEAALEARALGLDELEAELLTRAAVVVAEAGIAELAAWVLADADQAVAARGRRGDPRAVRIEWARARLAQRDGDLDEALRGFERARELARALGQPFASERISIDIGNVELLRGELDRAQASYERALEHERRRWGSASPTIARIEQPLGALALERGELDEAEAHFDAAARIFAFDGPTSPGLALLADGRAKLAFMRGELDEAREQIERGLTIFEANAELETEQACNLALALGVVRYFEGDLEGSIVAYERALRLTREVHGDRHALVGLTRSNIGESLLALGQIERARAEFLAALAVLEPAVEHDDPRLALPLSGLGLCDLEEGEHELAARRLERALALVDGEAEPQELAKIQLGLARALAGSGGELERARELAAAAAAGYARLGLDDLRAAAERWRP